MNDRGTKTVAFALGGLAGNNAHGAGFLQAALDAGVEPLMISCTSGQIRWAFDYLSGPEGRHGASLRDLMEDMIARGSPSGNKTLDLAALGLYGMPGVLHPDWGGFLKESFQNATETLTRVVRAPWDVIPLQEALKTIPCHLLEPEKDRFFHDASDLFNNHEVGIVFNSFNAVDGIENVYLNEAARRLLNRGKPARSGLTPQANGARTGSGPVIRRSRPRPSATPSGCTTTASIPVTGPRTRCSSTALTSGRSSSTS